MGQGVAADSIVEQVNRDAFGGFFQQQFVQALTEAIVVKDKKLNQHGFFCLVDGIENRIEGCPAVNQQPHLVVGQTRHMPELRHGP
ncbi:hypothetical protein D3C85_1770970 [compost metagenome]